MKREEKLQRELIAALGVLRQLTREVGGNYLAGLQAEVTTIERAVREIPEGKRKAQLRTMLKAINELNVKPQKGRRRDLKELDRRISKLTDITNEW